MRAKVVHDDINAGGGSERLAIITMGLLAEMGFKVDLTSFKKPNVGEIKKDFGDIVDFTDINWVPLDFSSMLRVSGRGISQHISGISDRKGTTHADKTEPPVNSYSNNREYDLIINTHGDILPYYDQTDHDDYDLLGIGKKRIMITYCHFPLVPRLLQQDYNGNSQGYMRFVRRWVKVDEKEKELRNKILENASKTYDLMIRNTTVLTNSDFSKRAIEQHYGQIVKPTVVYPPVDIAKFGDIALCSDRRENTVLILSRFSPDKEIENAIEISKILINEKKIDAKIILVGNIATEDRQYLQELKQLIVEYELHNNFTVEVGISFGQLLDIMRKSKVYLHPLAGEPFGISVVEAMSAGLIPVVPDEGGYTEFVPEHYRFHTSHQAADIIGKILVASDNYMRAERIQLSRSVSRFSIENYKTNLRKVIEPVLSSKLSRASSLAA